MAHLKKWWTAYGALVIAFCATIWPIVEAHHPSIAGRGPEIAGYAAAIATLLAGLSKSPVGNGNTQ